MKKSKLTLAIGVLVILVLATVGVVMWKQASSNRTKLQQASVVAAMERIQRVNVSRPERQTQAKMLVFTAIMQKKVPGSYDWCETLNVGGKLWPVTPTNTIFALNVRMAGQAFEKGLHGDAVVFYEASHPGWNQAGGAELLAQNADGVAVAIADGSALIVSPEKAAKLRWAP